MKIFARIVCIPVFLALVVPFSAFAQIIPGIDVPDHCTVIDTDGSPHAYASGQFLGICALQAAIDAGSVSGVEFSNAFPSLGLFVTAIGGVTADPGSQYWALLQNGNYASLGLSQLTVSAGDVIVLELHDFSDNFLGSRLTLNVGSLVSTQSAAPPSGGGGLDLHAPFDVTMALYYLSQMQGPDGSFDSPLLSDWAALAFANGGAGDAQKKLSKYFVANPPALGSVTDDERHAMALEALDINPYSGTPVDYITPIAAAFDGTQIGDPSLVNDDIFALFPLLHAGFSTQDDIIKKTTAFIVSKQLANGSWENSVDLSAAAVQALSLVHPLPGASDAVASALNYVHTQEQADGSFGNSFSTTWALQAIAAVPDSQISWYNDYHTPQYYFATLQQTDGGVEPASTATSTRVWATEYAIPAVQGKTWSSLLQTFAKPAPVTDSASTTSPATPTPPYATTTPDIVSVPPVSVPAAAETVEHSEPTSETSVVSMTSTDAGETAAAASVGDNVFGNLWHAVTSFFSSLF